MAQPLINELTAYLATFGIDASRVKADDYDEDGYTTLSEAGPITTSGRSWSETRTAWPSKEVYDNVCALVAGISIANKPVKKATTQTKKPAS